MKLTIGGNAVHVATGGRKHNAGARWIVFLHGSGYSHLSWVLQARALAYDGWNVLAPDLPGHGLSQGEPPGTVEEMAAFVLAVMDLAGAQEAVLAGHSMGGLIALEIARTAPRRVAGLILIGTSAEIPVNPKLIETAERDPAGAIAQMNSWGYGPGAHLAQNTWPGANHIGFGIAVMRQGHRNALAQGLKACAAYRHGADAARGYKGRALCIFSELDRMTPLRNGLALAAMLADARTVQVKGCGHTVHTEAPREVNDAIRSFIASAS